MKNVQVHPADELELATRLSEELRRSLSAHFPNYGGFGATFAFDDGEATQVSDTSSALDVPSPTDDSSPLADAGPAPYERPTAPQTRTQRARTIVVALALTAFAAGVIYYFL